MRFKDIVQSKIIPNLLFISGWMFFAIISLFQIIMFIIYAYNPEQACMKCNDNTFFLIMLISNIIIFSIYVFIFLKLKEVFFGKKANLKNKYKYLFTCFLWLCLYISYFYFILVLSMVK